MTALDLKLAPPVRQFEELLKAARTLDECWEALEEASRALGFRQAQLQFHGQSYHSRLADFERSDCWNVRVPLCEDTAAQFSVPFEGQLPPMAIAAFAKALRNYLAPRLRAFSCEDEFQPTGD